MAEDFSSYKSLKTKKPGEGERRWYDSSFIKKFVDSFETVPAYKRDPIANKINDVIEQVFKNEINKKVNTNKNMVLGMYKEFEKRRWYDRNPNVLKAIKGMLSLSDQRRELQKVAIAGIIDALGEYYIKDDAKEIEIREAPAEPVVKKEEPKPEPKEDEKPKKKSPDSKVMVSGEKLFIKRDKKPKPRPKI